MAVNHPVSLVPAECNGIGSGDFTDPAPCRVKSANEVSEAATPFTSIASRA